MDTLHGTSYTIIPDQIEAGSYMVAAAATGGNVLVRGVIPKHLESISAKLEEMGVLIEEYDDAIRISRNRAAAPLQRQNHVPPRLPHRYAAPDFGAAYRGERHQHSDRKHLRQSFPVCGRASPHGRAGAGGRQGRRFQGWII